MCDPRFLYLRVRNREQKEEADEDKERQATTTDLPEKSYVDPEDGPELW